MTKEQLNEIIDSYKWIKVKKYDHWCNGTESQKEMDLLNHHKKETEFLIKKCREMANELLDLKSQDRLIKLLIQEVTAFWENEGYSPGLNNEEYNEIMLLLMKYPGEHVDGITKTYNYFNENKTSR